MDIYSNLELTTGFTSSGSGILSCHSLLDFRWLLDLGISLES